MMKKDNMFSDSEDRIEDWEEAEELIMKFAKSLKHWRFLKVFYRKI